jgi:uncharacterized protein (TIGR02118 family)
VIRVSVLYPTQVGSRFDMDYYCYCATHMPLAQKLLAPAITGIAVEQGICGNTADSPPNAAMGYLLFESAEAFLAAFVPNATALLDDIPNYTNVQPTIQISEVKI